MAQLINMLLFHEHSGPEGTYVSIYFNPIPIGGGAKMPQSLLVFRLWRLQK